MSCIVLHQSQCSWAIKAHYPNHDSFRNLAILKFKTVQSFIHIHNIYIVILLYSLGHIYIYLLSHCIYICIPLNPLINSHHRSPTFSAKNHVSAPARHPPRTAPAAAARALHGRPPSVSRWPLTRLAAWGSCHCPGADLG